MTAQVLEEVHREYYANEEALLADVKLVLDAMKRAVFSGLVLAFSGVIPQRVAPASYGLVINRPVERGVPDERVARGGRGAGRGERGAGRAWRGAGGGRGGRGAS